MKEPKVWREIAEREDGLAEKIWDGIWTALHAYEAVKQGKLRASSLKWLDKETDSLAAELDANPSDRTTLEYFAVACGQYLAKKGIKV